MNSFDNPHDEPRRWGGIALVAALHVCLAWALVSGTAHHGLSLIKKTLAAEMIQVVHIAPPPPPPPPPKAMPRPRLAATVPPPYVPPPDVPVAATGPAIESSALVPHEPPPPATHAVTAIAGPPSPPAPPAPVAQPLRRDISLVCPTQVPPEMPRRALLDGVEGVVRAQATIQDGVVREVNILSGPRVFYSAVRSAMLQYKCEREANVVVATQEFNFRLE